MMQFRFSRSSRKHHIGRTSATAALQAAGKPQVLEDGKLLWIGHDSRERELELVGVIAVEDPNLVITIHVMPTIYRKKGHWE